MSEKKHTPGPWRFAGFNDENYNYRLGVFTNNKDSKSEPKKICTMPNDDSDFSNAALIAAAPDMLEMLEKIYAATDFIELRELINRAKNG